MEYKSFIRYEDSFTNRNNSFPSVLRGNELYIIEKEVPFYEEDACLEFLKNLYISLCKSHSYDMNFRESFTNIFLGEFKFYTEPYEKCNLGEVHKFEREEVEMPITFSYAMIKFKKWLPKKI